MVCSSSCVCSVNVCWVMALPLISKVRREQIVVLDLGNYCNPQNKPTNTTKQNTNTLTQAYRTTQRANGSTEKERPDMYSPDLLATLMPIDLLKHYGRVHVRVQPGPTKTWNAPRDEAQTARLRQKEQETFRISSSIL